MMNASHGIQTDCDDCLARRHDGSHARGDASLHQPGEKRSCSRAACAIRQRHMQKCDRRHALSADCSAAIARGSRAAWARRHSIRLWRARHTVQHEHGPPALTVDGGHVLLVSSGCYPQTRPTAGGHRATRWVTAGNARLITVGGALRFVMREWLLHLFSPMCAAHSFRP